MDAVVSKFEQKLKPKANGSVDVNSVTLAEYEQIAKILTPLYSNDAQNDGTKELDLLTMIKDAKKTASETRGKYAEQGKTGTKPPGSKSPSK